MASDGNPGKISVTSLVLGSQAVTSVNAQSGSGKSLPPAGKGPTAAAASTSATAAKSTVRATDPQTLVDQLNKYLNDSGRPDEYRVDPASDNKLIQQINPANGVVVGEFSVDEFPALARSIGASGLLVDSIA
jgi:hypothetical protein